MNMQFFRKHLNKFSVITLFTFVSQMILPSVAFAITGHDSMPEYRSFEPVATTNMVNPFTGDFTYNIPLLDVPNGYPINLSYHSSDVNNEAQASWVGLGWTLNPGAINRMKRGIPDDVNGATTTYYNKMPSNRTIEGGLSAGVNVELFGHETPVPLSLTGNLTLRFNNNNGISLTKGFGASFIGVNANYSYSAGQSQTQFGFSLSGFVNAIRHFKIEKEKLKAQNSVEFPSYDGDVRKFIEAVDDYCTQVSKISNNADKKKNSYHLGGAHFGSPTQYPTNLTSYTGFSYTGKLELGPKFAGLPINFLSGALKFTYSQQDNNSVNSINTYGYLHNEKAWKDDEASAMMDYNTDNDHGFDPRDLVLGVPIPNNDVFNLSGEGMGGSFRAFRSEFGHYRKNNPGMSVMNGGSIGVDVSFPIPADVAPEWGLNGGGMSLHTTELGKWSDLDIIGGNDPLPAFDNERYIFQEAAHFRNNTNERFFFRFNGDLGGKFDLYNSQEEVLKARLKGHGMKAYPTYDGYNGYSALLPEEVELSVRNLRSSFIDYALNSDFDGNGTGFRVNSKKLYVLDGTSPSSPSIINLTRNANSIKDNIGEFATYNADGTKYVYGLPIYTRDEHELSYSLEKATLTEWMGSNIVKEIDNSTIADVANNSKRKMGYKSEAEYASQYLLTQISSSDYVDRTYNGLTRDDFGSYTRFNYQRNTGAAKGAWYGFRSPFKGVNYNRGSLSRTNDDMGSFNFGLKELYYLQSVVSKTHVAIFSLGERKDGLGVSTSTDADVLLKGGQASTSHKLQYLDKIDLYAIEDCELIGTEEQGFYKPLQGVQPIKTVHFQYNYSLAPHTPNSLNNLGKLTLKKVWFTYGGKVKSKLSPYEFKYEYPKPADFTPNAANVVAKYGDIINGFNVSNPSIENPEYKPENTDRWGNYQNYADLASNVGPVLARFFPFNNQNPNTTDTDPAAYCLKQILLPSGGSILIQYESHDYSYVQDKRAMVMVPLTNRVISEERDTRYYLDLTKIGIDWGNINLQDKDLLCKELFEPIDKEKQRIYFNFLYDLVGAGEPNVDEITSEYIDGYARVDGYGHDDDGVYFNFDNNTTISNPGTNNVYNDIQYDNHVRPREIPRKACKDFYNSQRRLAESPMSIVLGETTNPDQVKGILTNLVSEMDNIFSSLLNSQLCKNLDEGKSFVRLQMPLNIAITTPTGTTNTKIGKLGGGARVKYLLTYDEGTSTASPAVLYGSEYEYKTTDDNGKTISSGVATNEPQMGGKENVLCQPFPRNYEASISPLLVGMDTYGNEGPIAQSLYPAPSIGYSKVFIKNIHSGKTGTGYAVNEYYTCKDYPIKVEHTEIEAKRENLGAIDFDLISLFTYSRNLPYLSQGYRITFNAMHGQPRRVATYAEGDEMDSGNATTEQTYSYFEPGEPVDVMGEDFQRESVQIGKESELLAEANQIYEASYGAGVESDVTAGVMFLFIPIPIGCVTALPNGYFIESGLATHVTNQIISYPAILKKTTSKTDNIRHITEHLVFDKYTGAPVYSRSMDDFNGSYFTQDIKASWFYDNMRSKAINKGLILNMSSAQFSQSPYGGLPYLQLTGGANCALVGKVVPGDLLLLNPNSGNGLAKHLYHVSDIDAGNGRIYLMKSALSTTSTPPTIVNYVEVIQSGYTNQLASSIGNYTIHDPIGKKLYHGIAANGPSSLSNVWTDNDGLVTNMNNHLVQAVASPGLHTANMGSGYNLSLDLDPCKIPQQDCYSVNDFTLNFNNSNAASNANYTHISVAGGSINGPGGLSFACGNGIHEKQIAPTFQPKVVNAIPSIKEDVENTLSRMSNMQVVDGDNPSANKTNDIPENCGCTTLGADIPLNYKISSDFCNNNSHTSVLQIGVNGQDPNNFYSNGMLCYDPSNTDAIGASFMCSAGSSWHSLGSSDYFEIRLNKWDGASFSPITTEQSMQGSISNNIVSLLDLTNFLHSNIYSDGLYQLVVTNQCPQHACDHGLQNNLYICANGFNIDCSDIIFSQIEPTPIKGGAEFDCLKTDGSIQDKISIGFTPPSFYQVGNFSDVTWSIGFPPSVSTGAVIVPGTENSINGAEIEATLPGVYYVTLNASYTFPNGEMKQLDPITCEITIPHCECYNPALLIVHEGDGTDDQIICLDGQDCLEPVEVSSTFSLVNCTPKSCELVVGHSNSPNGPFIKNNYPVSGGCNPAEAYYNITSPGYYTFQHVLTLFDDTPVPSLPSTAILAKDCRKPKATFSVVSEESCPKKTVHLVAQAAPSNCPTHINTYEWDFGDGNTGLGSNVTHVYAGCGPYTVKLTVKNDYGSFSPPTQQVLTTTQACHPICQCGFDIPNGLIMSQAELQSHQQTGLMPAGKGMFYKNTTNGVIAFRVPDCDITIPVPCFKKCTDNGQLSYFTVDNVVSASAITLSDEWGYNEFEHKRIIHKLYNTSSADMAIFNQLNDFEKGFRGKWRLRDQYAYRSDINENPSTTPPIADEFSLRNKNFNAGRFTLKMFDWEFGSSAEEWVLTSTTTCYSPNGNPIEDRDILGVYSSAKFAKNQTLLSAAAKNAPEEAIGFESFENGSNYLDGYDEVIMGGLFGAAGTVSQSAPQIAHTGTYSVKFHTANQYMIIGGVSNEALPVVGAQGLMIRAWFKIEPNTSPILKVAFYDFGNNVSTELQMKEIATAGEWKLFEAKWTPSYTLTQPVWMGISSSETNVYMDDLRYQPQKSEMVCYVYDKVQRLVAVLDDQHFASLYQYNDEGLLVRKQKETIKGIKTISEQQYNSKK